MDERHAYWWAALLDGEGCIRIRTRRGSDYKVVFITIAQNDRRLLDRAREYAGCGSIYGGAGPLRRGFQLHIQRIADVRRVLAAIRPHLVLKGERADAAMLATERPLRRLAC